MSIADILKKFQGHSTPAIQPAQKKSDKINPQPPRSVIRIDFEMMLKGSIYERPSGKVKQYGVTVDGATKVVTSGDYVGRETYDALLKAGAIRPKSENSQQPETALPPQKRR